MVNMNMIIFYLEYNTLLFENNLKISELQFTMKYWNIYFSDYLQAINNDLNNFKVSDLLRFIHTEESLFQDLILNE